MSVEHMWTMGKFKEDADVLADIAASETYEVSLVLKGRLYDVGMVVKPFGKFAVKVLNPLTIYNYYPSGMEMGDIFQEHRREHGLFLKHLSEFIVPTCFCDVSGAVPMYKIIQPWIANGLQYKEAINSQKRPNPSQLPPVDERERFVAGIQSLIADLHVRPQLPDLDFVIVNDNGSHIKVTDTNYLWWPKGEDKDVMRMMFNLEQFLRVRVKYNS